jgi:DNA-binding PadR family transcriptional regulator
MTQSVPIGSLPLSSLEEAILTSLLLEERYGLQIVDALKEITGNKIEINWGTIYPTLRKLEKRGLLESRLENKRLEVRRGNVRKYYKITPIGRHFVEQMNYIRQQLMHWKLS